MDTKKPTHGNALSCVERSLQNASNYFGRCLGEFLGFLGQSKHSRSRFMQRPTDNDLAQSGAVLDFSESLPPLR
jgi:hypothetical protein